MLSSPQFVSEDVVDVLLQVVLPILYVQVAHLLAVV